MISRELEQELARAGDAWQAAEREREQEVERRRTQTAEKLLRWALQVHQRRGNTYKPELPLPQTVGVVGMGSTLSREDARDVMERMKACVEKAGLQYVLVPNILNGTDLVIEVRAYAPVAAPQEKAAKRGGSRARSEA